MDERVKVVDVSRSDGLSPVGSWDWSCYHSAHRGQTTVKVVVSVLEIVEEMDVSSDEVWPFLNTRTGELVTLTNEALCAAEEDEDVAQYPDWEQELIIKAKEVINSTDYLRLPSKFDIHEYQIMEDFCYSVADDEFRRILLAGIRGRGAFRRFKDAIRVHEIEQKWYRFRHEQLKKIAIDWLEANQIPYTQDEG